MTQPAPLFDGCLEGHPALLVGGGPSLGRIPLGTLHRRDEFVRFALNVSFQVCAADLVVGMDAQWWREWGPRVPHSVPRVWLRPHPTAAAPEHVSHVIPCAGDPNYPPGPHWDPTWGTSLEGGLGGGGHTGFFALNLAYVLGCRPIYLLGFDYEPGADGRQVHYHREYAEEGDARAYERMVRSFDAVPDEAARLVVNVNPWSRLGRFRRGNLPGVERTLFA